MILRLWFEQSVRLSLLFFIRKIRPGNLAPFHRPPICDATQPTHWPQHSRIDYIPILVDRILPYPEPHPLDNSQHPRFLARRGPALKFRRRKQFAFDTENRLFHARRPDLRARGGGKTAQCPFGYAVGRIDTRSIGGLDEVFADDVDGTFFGGFEVAQRVFGVGVAACEADGEERRVVVYDVGVGEWCEVGGGALGICQPEESVGIILDHG